MLLIFVAHCGMKICLFLEVAEIVVSLTCCTTAVNMI